MAPGLLGTLIWCVLDTGAPAGVGVLAFGADTGAGEPVILGAGEDIVVTMFGVFGFSKTIVLETSQG